MARRGKNGKHGKQNATGDGSDARFGGTWWGRLWVHALARFTGPNKLSAGASLAHTGGVEFLELAKGTVVAMVPDCSAVRYRVEIRVTPFSLPEWTKLMQALPPGAVSALETRSSLLPLETVLGFQQAVLRLIPKKFRDLEMRCPCTDWFKPCVHQLAVWLLLAEEFDWDPLFIFKLRGLEREEFLDLLAGAPTAEDAGAPPEADPGCQQTPPEPLPVDPGRFWASGKLPEHLELDPIRPALYASLPKRLGHFPLWPGAGFLSAMEKTYKETAEFALRLLSGDSRLKLSNAISMLNALRGLEAKDK